jgi:hypothetical protein
MDLSLLLPPCEPEDPLENEEGDLMGDVPLMIEEEFQHHQGVGGAGEVGGGLKEAI